MDYQIRMAAEVKQWLAHIRDHEPALADRVDEALAALQAEGRNLGPPLVVPVHDPLCHDKTSVSIPGRRTVSRRNRVNAHLRKPLLGRSVSGASRWPMTRTPSRGAFPDLDAAYERQIEALTRVRLDIARVSTSGKRLQRHIGELERQAGELGDQSREAMEAGQRDIAGQAQARRAAIEAQLASLRRQYAGVQAEEERVTVAGRRLTSKVEAFRTCKEATEAAYTAVEEAEAARADRPGDVGIQDVGACHAAGITMNAGPDGPAAPLSWLSELRPGAPESVDARILFTVEPSGTAVLLVAGTERDWLRAWHTEAITHSRIRYQREQQNIA